MRPVQFFSDEYLEHCKSFSAEQILGFLEDFRLLHEPPQRSKLISLKVPEYLLGAFRRKADAIGVP